MTPKLSLDGSPKEYDFPDFSKCSDIKVPENLFQGISDSAPSSPIKGEENGAQLEQLQEDLDNLKSKVLQKDNNISQLKTRLESKEQEISEYKS